MENQDKEETFHVGICMAGAISAGAYTAGVMDYLLEALEHWEKAKSLQKEGKLSGIPKHHLSIEVLGGASAGGMTAAVTAAGVHTNFEPVTQRDENNEAKLKQNPLYHSWVNLTETSEKDMMAIMLSTDDIEKDPLGNKKKEVRAGLNSTFIKEIADKSFAVRYTERYERKYLAKDLDLFTTVTNLRGFNYNIKFSTSSGQREHRMRMHRDYAFFKLTDDKFDNDGRIPVNFNAPNGLNTDKLGQAAMSTGAFPVGLESRQLVRESKYILANKYLNLRLSDPGNTAEQKVEYTFLPKGDDFLSLNVDGGVINNEPYEITQQLLDDRHRQAMIEKASGDEAKTAAKMEGNNYQPPIAAANFHSTVLMIDPFPNDEEEQSEEFVPKKAWKNVLPGIINAMQGQLRMKDEQIRRAYLSDDYTRFLVMPVRSLGGVNQVNAIACGSLGGFGGFLSKDFRRHDFYLGRRNCQRFLQKYFSVPETANNPILSFGFDGVANFNFTDDKGVVYLPLIPDMRVKYEETSGIYTTENPLVEEEYAYPKIKLSYILHLEGQINDRIKAILSNIQHVEQAERPNTTRSLILARIRKKNWFQRLFGQLKNWGTDVYLAIGKYVGKGALTTVAIDAIIMDMEKKELIDDDLV